MGTAESTLETVDSEAGNYYPRPIANKHDNSIGRENDRDQDYLSDEDEDEDEYEDDYDSFSSSDGYYDEFDDATEQGGGKKGVGTLSSPPRTRRTHEEVPSPSSTASSQQSASHSSPLPQTEVLRGAIIGVPKSGKTSLWRRLQGKDFKSEVEVEESDNQRNHFVNILRAVENARMCTIKWRPQQSIKKSDMPYPIVRVQVLDVDVAELDANNSSETDVAEVLVPFGLLHFLIWIVDPARPVDLQYKLFERVLENIENGVRIPIYALINFRDREDNAEKLHSILSQVENIFQNMNPNVKFHVSTASMKNCYGLIDLHYFFSIPYVFAQKIKIERRLWEIDKAISERWSSLSKASPAMSYESFIKMLGAGKKSTNETQKDGNPKGPKQTQSPDLQTSKLELNSKDKKSHPQRSESETKNNNSTPERQSKIEKEKDSVINKEARRSILKKGEYVSDIIYKSSEKNDKKQVALSEQEQLDLFLASSDEEEDEQGVSYQALYSGGTGEDISASEVRRSTTNTLEANDKTVDEMASDSLHNEITVESNNAEDNPPASSNCASSNGGENDRTVEKPNGLENDETDSTLDNDSIYSKSKSVEEYSKDHLVNGDQQDKVEESCLPSNGGENDRTAEKPNGLENDETDSTLDNNSIYSKSKSVEEYSKDHLVNGSQQDKVGESCLPSNDWENDETDSTLDNNINVSKRKSLEDFAEDYTVNDDEKSGVEESCLPSRPSHQILSTVNNSAEREYIVSKSERDEGEYGKRVEQTETFDKDSEYEQEPHSSDNDEYTSKVSTGLRTSSKSSHRNGTYQTNESDKCREESNQRELSSKSEMNVSKEESCVLNKNLGRSKESNAKELQNSKSNLEQAAADEEMNVQLDEDSTVVSARTTEDDENAKGCRDGNLISAVALKEIACSNSVCTEKSTDNYSTIDAVVYSSKVQLVTDEDDQDDAASEVNQRKDPGISLNRQTLLAIQTAQRELEKEINAKKKKTKKKKVKKEKKRKKSKLSE